jgi:NADH:ubiquinone oxidoreductase subunit K
VIGLQVTLTHFIVLSAVLFCIGLYGVLAKRNVVAILMSVELMFNSVNVALIAFSRYPPADAAANAALTGQVFALFVIAVAAAEAAVALAMILAIYRLRRSVNIEEVNLLKW